MFKTKDKKDEITNLQMSMMVGTAMELQGNLMKLMQEYENKGIKEISISVLKDMISESFIKNISPEGLVGMMIKKGDI